jgi:hypothetical protein
MIPLRPTLLLTLFAAIELASLTTAQARGAASNIMNSPGYQRRLQESRGYVTNQSGSIYAPPAAAAPRAVKPRRQRR